MVEPILFALLLLVLCCLHKRKTYKKQKKNKKNYCLEATLLFWFLEKILPSYFPYFLLIYFIALWFFFKRKSPDLILGNFLNHYRFNNYMKHFPSKLKLVISTNLTSSGTFGVSLFYYLKLVFYSIFLLGCELVIKI